MRTHRLRGIAALCILALVILPAGGCRDDSADGDNLRHVLVFTATAGFRHASIADGVTAIQDLGNAHGFRVTSTEAPARFTDTNLAAYDAVVWLSTSGDVLAPGQQAAFERYIRGGGGYVGVHAAADTEYDWPWYGDLLGGGAWFASHPAIQPAALTVATADHAATAHLPPRLLVTDEWYNFRTDPSPEVTVLLSLDETSYDPGPDAMGSTHPLAWCHAYDGGRAFYTGLGHRPELYAWAPFRLHLLGGLRWAAGVGGTGTCAGE